MRWMNWLNNLNISTPEILTDRIDVHFYLYPNSIRHGDPIPDKEGNILTTKMLPSIKCCRVMKVSWQARDRSYFTQFLQYLGKIGLVINTKIRIKDDECMISAKRILNGKKRDHRFPKVSANLIIRKSDSGGVLYIDITYVSAKPWIRRGGKTWTLNSKARSISIK